MQQITFTKDGYESFKKEYEQLQFQRPEAVEHLKKARELGDLKENGYYKASRAKLSSIDSRLFHLKSLLKQANIVTATRSDIVGVGVTVTLTDGKQQRIYKVVGQYEANPAEGKISIQAPLGKELVGKKVGDKVIIHAPKGKIVYTLVKIIV